MNKEKNSNLTTFNGKLGCLTTPPQALAFIYKNVILFRLEYFHFCGGKLNFSAEF